MSHHLTPPCPMPSSCCPTPHLPPRVLPFSVDGDCLPYLPGGTASTCSSLPAKNSNLRWTSTNLSARARHARCAHHSRILLRAGYLRPTHITHYRHFAARRAFMLAKPLGWHTTYLYAPATRTRCIVATPLLHGKLPSFISGLLSCSPISFHAEKKKLPTCRRLLTLHTLRYTTPTIYAVRLFWNIIGTLAHCPHAYVNTHLYRCISAFPVTCRGILPSRTVLPHTLVPFHMVFLLQFHRVVDMARYHVDVTALPAFYAHTAPPTHCYLPPFPLRERTWLYSAFMALYYALPCTALHSYIVPSSDPSDVPVPLLLLCYTHYLKPHQRV